METKLAVLGDRMRDGAGGVVARYRALGSDHPLKTAHYDISGLWGINHSVQRGALTRASPAR